MFLFVDTSTGCLTISLYSYLFSFVFNFFECEETFFFSVSFKKPYIRVKVAEGFNLRKVILHCRESGYDAASPDVNYQASHLSKKKVRLSMSSSKRILPFDFDQIPVKFVS